MVIVDIVECCRLFPRLTDEEHIEDGGGPSQSGAAISTDQFATLMAEIG